MIYNILKSLHIIFFTTWMAGIFYLPRLFVYHSCSDENSEQYKTFIYYGKKLLRFIMNPSMFLTWFLGIALALLHNYLLSTWFIIKIALVILMSVFHMYCAKIRNDFEKYNNKKKENFFRIVNEIPTILFILIVLLVVFKPFD